MQVGVQLALFAASVMSKKEFVLRVKGARLVILTVVGTYICATFTVRLRLLVDVREGFADKRKHGVGGKNNKK